MSSYDGTTYELVLGLKQEVAELKEMLVDIRRIVRECDERVTNLGGESDLHTYGEQYE